MDSLNHRSPWLTCLLFLVIGLGLLALAQGQGSVPKPPDAPAEYAQVVQPLVKRYCLDCHSTKAKKGSLDLERFGALEQVRKDIKPWQQTIEMLEAGEMPPKGKPQPTADERKQLVAWIRGFLDAEARARAGDPGYVPLRRLSNAEYDATIRDLTGVDLRSTREFPADGAAGEGFTNAAEALSDISPALLTKYLNAAKDTAEHAVLLPDGFRFSPGKTRRDWTDEATARLRKFYTAYTADGRLALQPYLVATVRHREALTSGKITVQEVAQAEKLNPKYLGVLWRTLADQTPLQPLDAVRGRWRSTSEKDVPALTAEITAWQKKLWKFVPVGSYRYGATVRQVANDPPVLAAPSGEAYEELLRGQAAFRQCFPWFVCFPNVVPTDETVCLKMFHREDEPLTRLFLDEAQQRQLDRLWDEHRFISQQPLAENAYLPQFIGYVTQDQPKELLGQTTSRRMWLPRSRSSRRCCSTSPAGLIVGRCTTRKRPNCSVSTALSATRVRPTTKPFAACWPGCW
jgi:mono/diheme cytochrome c family protein